MNLLDTTIFKSGNAIFSTFYLNNARLKREHFRQITHRQVLDFLGRAHHFLNGDILVDHGTFGRHNNLLPLNKTFFHADIDARRLVHNDTDILRCDSFVSNHRGFYRVSSNRDILDVIISGKI